MNKNPDQSENNEYEIPDWATEPHPRDILKRQYEEATKRPHNEALGKHGAAIELSVSEDLLQERMKTEKILRPFFQTEAYRISVTQECTRNRQNQEKQEPDME